MKNLTFQEILIISEAEKKARRIVFHPKMTVIKGENDTGKSTLLKNIYAAFGATPHQLSDKWKGAAATICVKFMIEHIPYTILKHNERYSLFDSSGILIKSFKSVTKELAPYLADLFDFKLQILSNKAPVQATPAFLFLPFYFDQDSSWTSQWNGFDKLSQFQKWKKDVIEFHVGIRPSEYYNAKATQSILDTKKQEEIKARDVIAHARNRVCSEILNHNFDIDINTYLSEFHGLIESCTNLNKRESDYSEKMAMLFSDLKRLENEKKSIDGASNESIKDMEYAFSKNGNIECPTCGFEHENSFELRLSLANDVERFKQISKEIQDDINRMQSLIITEKCQLEICRKESAEIMNILKTKKENIEIIDIIKSEGRKEVRSILDANIYSHNDSIKNIDIDMDILAKKMKSFDDKNRRKLIEEYYSECMMEIMAELDVPTASEKSWKEITCVLHESGSDLPRILLAYYYSYLRVIYKYGSSTFCPIVMDSPKQQDQDNYHWKKMIEVIIKYQPNDSQIILSLVDDLGVDFGGSVIELSSKRSLLEMDQYNEVKTLLSSYLNQHFLDQVI